MDNQYEPEEYPVKLVSTITAEKVVVEPRNTQMDELITALRGLSG